MTDPSASFQKFIQDAERDTVESGRRRFFVSMLAGGAGIVTASAWGQSSQLIIKQAASTGGRLTIGEAGRGPVRFHPSFVKDVGLMTDLNGFLPLSFRMRNALRIYRTTLDSSDLSKVCRSRGPGSSQQIGTTPRREK